MKMIHSGVLKTFLVALALPEILLAADFKTRIQHDFTGDAAAGLDGMEVDAGSDRVTWQAPGEYLADGSFHVFANGSAWVPIVIDAGKTYKISVDVTLDSAQDGTHWVGIGFGTDSLLTAAALTQGTRGVAALTLRQDGKINAYVDGPIAVGSSTSNWGTEATLSLVLNTRADGSAWTVDFHVGDELLWSHEFPEAPMITRVAVGNGGPGENSGGFKNFKVMVSAGTE